MLLARRIAAGLLAVAALGLALRPVDSTVEIVVAARDLAPGTEVRLGDLSTRGWPAELLPEGRLTMAQAAGRVLAGALRAGEPVTDLRLVGTALAVRAAGVPDAAGVPVRLADPDVAALLSPGSRVDVVTASTDSGGPEVLAANAVVLTVLAAESPSAIAQRGRLVVVALPRDLATRVASASLTGEVTVTVR